MEGNDPAVSRRDLLSAVTGLGAAGTVASLGEPATAQEGETQRHTVEMTDDLVFDPDDLTIAPGDTVVWENVGTIGHSATAYEDGIPAEATYFASGGFDAESAARSSYRAGNPDAGDVGGGDSFEHTFDVEGTYDYFCVPHETVGMVATIEAVPGGAQPDGEESGPGSLPDWVRALGVATAGVFVTIVGLAYFFLKYGGDYGPIED